MSRARFRALSPDDSDEYLLREVLAVPPRTQAPTELRLRPCDPQHLLVSTRVAEVQALGPIRGRAPPSWSGGVPVHPALLGAPYRTARFRQRPTLTKPPMALRLLPAAAKGNGRVRRGGRTLHIVAETEGPRRLYGLSVDAAWGPISRLEMVAEVRHALRRVIR